MWILIVFLGLWILYGKSYYTFKFNALEGTNEGQSYSYFPYKLKQVNSRDFGFILNEAKTAEGKRLKFKANLLLMFFYVDLLVLIFLKDIANVLAS